jgi:hypothetical protein
MLFGAHLVGAPQRRDLKVKIGLCLQPLQHAIQRVRAMLMRSSLCGPTVAQN